MARHATSRRRRWKRLLVVAIPVAAVVLLLAAWGVDAHGHDGRVARNVSLAGHGVGGDSRDELAAEVHRQAGADRDVAVHIVPPGATYDTTAAAVGLALDEPSTVDAVMRVGHGDSVLTRPFRWLTSLFSTQKVTPRFVVDRTKTVSGARNLEGAAHVDPVEPSIAATAEGTVQVVAGKPGTGIDPNRLADAILAAAPSGSSDHPIDVHIEQGSLAPRFSDADAQRVADEANRLAHQSLTITIGAATKPVDPPTIA